MILLDTHALVWLAEGAAELGARARRLADRALAEDALAASAISFWEVAMLGRAGRLRLHQPVEAWRSRLLSSGLRELPLSGETAIAAVDLPRFHADPADRFIAATALRLPATLMTADQRILRWKGGLRCHDARR